MLNTAHFSTFVLRCLLKKFSPDTHPLNLQKEEARLNPLAPASEHLENTRQTLFLYILHSEGQVQATRVKTQCFFQLLLPPAFFSQEPGLGSHFHFNI